MRASEGTRVLFFCTQNGRLLARRGGPDVGQ
uniref:Uncharacterized protein n=1 Tax=Podoviridae sp. ctZih56 TaxID=2827741 RepID=A0A8S5SFV4_9CAUD|nr:MAG TPA: hypothetical protein [Podoviridae sp. ctZih56]